jgi:hypothetical protein
MAQLPISLDNYVKVPPVRILDIDLSPSSVLIRLVGNQALGTVLSGHL